MRPFERAVRFRGFVRWAWPALLLGLWIAACLAWCLHGYVGALDADSTWRF